MIYFMNFYYYYVFKLKIDSSDESGNLPGYIPTPEDLRLQEVYGDWVSQEPGHTS